MNDAAAIRARAGPHTDKFALGYFPAYEELARHIGPAGRVLEVGVYRGGSLMMWQGLFPDGIIAGADHDAACLWPEGTIRIIAAQDSPALAQAAADASPDGWDLIVDDASHHGALSAATWKLLWPQVRPGGWYVLEDWQVAYQPPWTAYGLYGGDSMLTLAQSWLPLLEPAASAAAPSPGSGIAELRYRFGQAMARKGES